MEQRTRGIILRTRPLTETSLIVNWLTADGGRISTVAKGARRLKSPFRGKLDLFFTADFTFLRSRRSDLHTLREVAVLQTRPVFREELKALRCGCYATAFLEQVTEPETPMPGLAVLFEQFLDILASRPHDNDLILVFELKMLAELGLAPDLTRTRLSEGARRVAVHFISDDWERLKNIKLTTAQTGELRQFLRGFLAEHLSRLPRGRETLWEGED